jgi:hypothetical protein
MNTNPSARDFADAMTRAGYRRQWYYGRWRVAWWPAAERYPQRMRNTVADRRAMLRTATRPKRPPYSPGLWAEVVMLLPAIATNAEFELACAETAETLHARYDNLDLIGGGPQCLLAPRKGGES